jgi:hypothetical protein
MRMYPAVIMATGLAFVTATAFAQPTPITVTADKQKGEDKLVCKRLDDGNLGSSIKRWTKTCKKKSEWAAEEAATANALQRMRDRSASDMSGSLYVGGSGPQP